jgi:hypothetical protein
MNEEILPLQWKKTVGVGTQRVITLLALLLVHLLFFKNQGPGINDVPCLKIYCTWKSFKYWETFMERLRILESSCQQAERKARK